MDSELPHCTVCLKPLRGTGTHKCKEHETMEDYGMTDEIKPAEQVSSEMLDAGFAAQEKLYEGDYSGEVEFQEARLAAAYRAMRCAAIQSDTNVTEDRHAQIWNDAIECAAAVAENQDRNETATAIRQLLSDGPEALAMCSISQEAGQ